jgi:hypothetical protein
MSKGKSFGTLPAAFLRLLCGGSLSATRSYESIDNKTKNVLVFTVKVFGDFVFLLNNREQEEKQQKSPFEP